MIPPKTYGIIPAREQYYFYLFHTDQTKNLASSFAQTASYTIFFFFDEKIRVSDIYMI